MITQKYINEISYKIIGCAIEVNKHLGPGLLINFHGENIKEQMVSLVTEEFAKLPKG